MSKQANTTVEAKEESRKRSPITERFRSEGKTIGQWAAENGFKLRNIQAVLYGHNKGYFGTSEKIAVALGMKRPTK